MTATTRARSAVSRGGAGIARKLDGDGPAATTRQAGQARHVAVLGYHDAGGRPEAFLTSAPATGTGTTADDYERSITRPADVLWAASDFARYSVTEVVKGRVWVVPEVLSGRECEAWLGRSLPSGPNSPLKALPCRGKRTQNVEDQEIASAVESRLPVELLEQLKDTAPWTEVRGVHAEWRVHRYTQGGSYCAHYDQDSFRTLDFSASLGCRERETSSHTLLICLSSENDFSGGGTRFWLDNNYNGPTVEVHLPTGSALVFQQHGTLHNEMPLKHGVKFTAETGLLRAQPIGSLKPAVFKWGPGLGCAYQVR